jgi:hypothetical protein
MTEPRREHRLDGLEADNLLAFLALLGLLRALETARPDWRPRACWDLGNPPLRPILSITEAVGINEICKATAAGIAALLAALDFRAASDLKLPTAEATDLLRRAGATSDDSSARYFSDLCAALLSDAVHDRDDTKVEPTPLAYPSVATSNFLRNLVTLANAELPEKKNRGRDPTYPKDAAQCIAQALFAPWQRSDRPVGLRWDPEEAKRHAYQWRAPTKDLPTTQHGANRLAIVGLATLTAVPSTFGTRAQLSVVGGMGTGDRFSVAWPIWSAPASLSAIRALLSHPQLREPGALTHLGVDHVRIARRVSLDRLRNFTSAEPIEEFRQGE